jgi:hypothetical protein
MAARYLATYLQDHRAGAVAAVELLAHVEAAHPGTEVERFAADLRADITADVRLLEDLMDRAGCAPSRARHAAPWLVEQVVELTTRLQDPGDGAFGLLEALEAVAIGIDGRRALWLTLADAANGTPALAGVPYDQLIRRAEAQRSAVEIQRQSAARLAFADDAGRRERPSRSA